MNWDQIAGNWKQFTGKVKEKWGKLTDDDLTAIAGKRDQLAGKLQERYGYATDQAERELDEFARGLKEGATPATGPQTARSGGRGPRLTFPPPRSSARPTVRTSSCRDVHLALGLIP